MDERERTAELLDSLKWQIDEAIFSLRHDSDSLMIAEMVSLHKKMGKAMGRVFRLSVSVPND